MNSLSIENNSLSIQWINLILLLIRYHFIYSKHFYSINLILTYLMTIYSMISIFLILFLNGIFEILFKQIYFLDLTLTRKHCYFSLISLFLSITSILIINSYLFRFIYLIYHQEQTRSNNQVKI